MKIIERISESKFIKMNFRLLLLKIYGIKCGKNVNIHQNVYFSDSNICIGDNSMVNCRCSFYSDKSSGAYIHIGNNCAIGMNTTVCTHSHKIGDKNKRAGESIYKKISIGDGSWICANCFIGPNVNIGNGCIIAAGSVVLNDCESNCLYAGIPAKKIKKLVSDDKDL